MAQVIFKWGLVLVIAGGAMFVADLIRCDYSYAGVFSILILYLFGRNKFTGAAAGAVSFLWEFPAPLGFLPVLFYNGKRGLRLKIFFYVFYPTHLLAIVLLCRIFSLI